MNDQDYLLIQQLLRFISASRQISPAAIDNAASCLARGNVHRACQYVWGASPPVGITLGDKWTYVVVSVSESGSPSATPELPSSGETQLVEIKAALVRARVYVEGAYECAFPDEAANESLLREIDAVLKAE